MTNPGTISHNEILTMYKQIVDPKHTWENFTYEEQRKILLAGRSNSALDTGKLKKLYPALRPIRDAVKMALQEMKKNDVARSELALKGEKMATTDPATIMG